jgi:hypothetical protein
MCCDVGTLAAQVDPREPAREFFFSVSVDEAEHYRLIECYPSIAPATRDALTRELNASNDFAAFVHAMRRAFRSMC